ncbi:integrin beta-4 isoform X2 [Hemiscyllium ocellatum]|uniref:integrin beta-4 isoform X2 n=1 Tax=Hemiscyllium ocellatum TaxID=170820 RepID=UPI002966246D|nr:integrin beta-4 isoform X2 [Hemiscyllium ocellatum]
MQWWTLWSSLAIVVLMGAMCYGQRSNRCLLKRSQTCSDCMRVDKDCSYCADEGINYPRCDLHINLQSKCKNIMRLQSSMKILRNTMINTSSKHSQISPQQLAMTLRAGEEKRIKFNVFQPLETPVDLYFLMDFSNSMEDDLDNLKKLGLKLADVVRNMSNDYTIGFGKFVDKVTVPQTDMRPSRLQEPWPNSDPPFSFKNVIPLTSDANNFTNELKKERISGNVDAPEGGFDAILQVAVCQNQIGWRNQSTHILVFSTESAFHYEADGSNVLSGILKRNDEHCHLDSKGSYTWHTLQDYPSIPTLVRHLTEQSIIPIFAVTNHSYSYYQKLSKYFPVSDIGQLQEDSSNIIELLRNAFENIRSKMEIRAENVPVTMSAKVSSLSSATSRSDSSVFTVAPGEVKEFELKVKAMDSIMCTNEKEQRANLIVKPSTFTDALTVDTSLLCEKCSCETNPEKNSPKCKGNGDFVCGQCVCKDNWQGDTCDCDTRNQDGTEVKACKNPLDNSQICSGRGDCYCGVCYCHPSEYHLERFEGKYCQYSTLHCPRFAGFMCNDHGECFEEKCICREGWTGDSCECPISNATCIDINGGLCNGNGVCDCGRCQCYDNNADPTCNSLQYLLGICEDLRSCVQCWAWNTGDKKGNNCKDCPQIFTFVEELKSEKEVTEHCEFRDEEDDCTFYYTVTVLPGSNQTQVEVLKKKDCPPGGFLWLIPLIIFLMLLLGLLLLLCWKYCACFRACCARLPCCAMLPCCAAGTKVGFKENRHMLNQSKLTYLDTPMLRKNKPVGTDVVRWKVMDNVHKEPSKRYQGTNSNDTVPYNLSLQATRIFNDVLKNPDSAEFRQLRLEVEENLNDVFKIVPGFQGAQKTTFRVQPKTGKREALTIIDTQIPALRSAEKQIVNLTEDMVSMGAFSNLKVMPGYYTVASDRDAHGQVEFPDGVESVNVRVPLFVKDEDDDEKQLQVEAVDVPKGNAEIDQPFVYITMIKQALAKSIITFMHPSYRYQRQDKVAKIPLIREIREDGRTQVSYRTKDRTAKDGKDYIATENHVTFQPGETRKEIPVVLLEQTEIDTLLGNEQEKKFCMELYNPQNGAKIGKYPETNVIITDDNERQIPIDTPPFNLKAHPIDSRRIQLNWNPPLGEPSGYRVEYWPEDDRLASQIMETRNTSAELINLQPGSYYAMNVLAYNDLGDGPQSAITYCHTLDEVNQAPILLKGSNPIKSAPTNLKAHPIDSRRIRLNWTPPPGQPSEYKVTYWIEGDENSSQVIKTMTPSADLTNLYPYCDYEMNVCAYNSQGFGPYSDVVQCRTLEDLPNQPGRLAFNVISPTVTQLSWAEPSETNGEITEYEVTYTVVTDENQPIGPKKTVKIDKPKKRMVMIENLKAEQPYLYTVRAKNGAGWGPVREATMNLSTQPKRPMSIPIIPDVPIIDAEAHDEYENFLMYSSDVMRSPRPSTSDDIGSKWQHVQLLGDGFDGRRVTWQLPVEVIPRLSCSSSLTHASSDIESLLSEDTEYSDTMRRKATPQPREGQDMSMNGKWEMNSLFPGSANSTLSRSTTTNYNHQYTRLIEDSPMSSKTHTTMMLGQESRSPGIPDTPTRLVFSALGATSLKVSWQKPQCDREIRGYRVTYQPLLGGETKIIDISNPEENSIIINDLLPNYSYMFKVMALSDKGWGPEREGVITIESKVDPLSPLSPVPGSPFTLSTPSAPGPLVFTAINSELLKLSWEKPRKPNGDIMGYLVTCEPLDGHGEIKTYQVEGDDAEMTLMVPHLSENVPYKFKVQAKTTQGYGPEREGIITIESQDGANFTDYNKQMVTRQEGYMIPGNMSTQTTLLQSTIDPMFSEGMTVTTQRMEGATSITQQITRTMMSGTVTKQMERKFYEA